MQSAKPIVCSVLVTLSLLVGCEKASTSSAVVDPSLKHVVTGTGIIRGKVTLAGTPPPMRTIENFKCHDGATEPIKEESVVANADGTLQHVFIYLKGVSADAPVGAVSPVLDQVKCQYVPHVIGVQAGQPLMVRNSDPAIHNVHFTPSKNPPDNLNMPRIAEEKTVVFKNPEFIRFKCDIHPWMAAYVGVFPSPFFATTGDKGTFEIPHLPAGTYTLAAWHERFGELEKQVTIEEGKPLDVNFNFAP